MVEIELEKEYPLNGLHYLEGMVYHIMGSFTSIDSFLEKLSPHFEELPFKKKSVVEKIKELIEKFDPANFDKINEETAVWICIRYDLQKILHILKSKDVTIENPYTELQKAYKKYVEIATSEFKDFEPPKLKIVDKFPEPYSDMEWIAFAPDKEDHEKFGIEPGIYIKSSMVSPYYTAYLLAHEFTHKIVEQFNSYGFGIGLEEGIAEFYGLHLSSKFLPMNVLKHILVYNYKYGERTRLTMLYEFFLLLTYYEIYKAYGMDGIRTIIKMGRKGIKRFEGIFLDGNWKLQVSDLEDRDRGIEEILDFYTHFPNDLYSTPIVKYISMNISIGDTARKIALKTKVDLDIVKNALNELQNTLVLILVEKDTVLNLNTSMLPKLRYKL